MKYKFNLSNIQREYGIPRANFYLFFKNKNKIKLYNAKRSTITFGCILNEIKYNPMVLQLCKY